jgi:hypothetical protein
LTTGISNSSASPSPASLDSCRHPAPRNPCIATCRRSGVPELQPLRSGSVLALLRARSVTVFWNPFENHKNPISKQIVCCTVPSPRLLTEPGSGPAQRKMPSTYPTELSKTNPRLPPPKGGFKPGLVFCQMSRKESTGFCEAFRELGVAQSPRVFATRRPGRENHPDFTARRKACESVFQKFPPFPCPPSRVA